MQVSQATKDAFKSQDSTKHLIIKLTRTVSGQEQSITIPETEIIADSMRMEESIIEGSDFTISGCIASSFEVKIFGNDSWFKHGDVNRWSHVLLEAKIKADNTDVIPLFTGLIYKADFERNTNIYTVHAYDDMYLFNLDKDSYGHFMMYGGMDAGYNYTKGFSSFFTTWLSAYLNKVDKENSCSLNPDFDMSMFPLSACTLDVLNWNSWANETTGLDFLRDVCETNGLIGYIDRNNYLSFINLKSFGNGSNAEEIPFYKNFAFNDKYVFFTSAIICNSSGDVVYTDSETSSFNYVIDGNPLIDCVTDFNNYSGILNNITDTTSSQYAYGADYSITTMGMPWLEVGKDWIKVPRIIRGQASEEYENTKIFKRVLQGIQNLTDTFSFTVDESVMNNNYNSSLQRQIDNLKNSRSCTKYVTSVPETFASNTIYFVRKSE